MIATEAEKLAINFLMAEWDIDKDDQEWFAILNSRLTKEGWYIVEIGVEGLPDKWVIQVYDNGDCDPNYTFASPISASDGTADLEELPERLASVIASERSASN